MLHRRLNGRAGLWLLGAVVLLVAAATAVFVRYWVLGENEREPVVTVQRTLVYKLEVINLTSSLLEEPSVVVFAPASLPGRQQLMGIETDTAYKHLASSGGNNKLRLTMDPLPPHGTRVLDLRFDLKVTRGNQAKAENGTQSLLSASLRYPSDHQRVKAVATQLEGATPEVIGRSIYDWVSNHIDGERYIARDLGALHALEHGEGDCTEYMTLTTTLARARGIPAHGMGGFVYSSDRIARPSDFHNWSEFRLGNRWQIVDAKNRRWTKDTTQYLVVRVFPGDADRDLNTQGIFVADDEVEVRMLSS